MRFVWAPLLLCLPSALAYFSPAFRAFLQNSYGVGVADILERRDFGDGGSFGGGTSGAGYNRPVVLVHGVTNTAGGYTFARNYLLAKGYGDNEVFATTYGVGEKKNMLLYTLDCEYARHVRWLIAAVFVYTNRKVDVIAYSLGSPVARKAILGGMCKGENLGLPLTPMIETFVGVAGANFGSFMCLPALIGICNTIDGLHCSSKYLAELNSQPYRYEAAHSYAIYSTGDKTVGTNCCGRNCSSLQNADQEYITSGLDHTPTIQQTLDWQYALIRHSNVVSLG